MSKADRLKARLPRGFADRQAADLAATSRMLEKIRGIFELYGFEGLETPFVEYTDSLGKFLPDLDRPNEGVFSFQDDDEQWMSLRYDLTAPLARYVAGRLDEQKLTLPYRSYRSGWVFRNEKPGPGRFRQFMQFDADIVGAGSVAADAEIAMLMADTLEAVGIKRGDYVVKVNNRKVLDGVLEAIGLGGEENAGRRLTVLRAIDKMDRLGIGEVARLLGPGRLDESGDFTIGANLSDEQIGFLLTYVQGGDPTTVAFEDRQDRSSRSKVSILSTSTSPEPQDQFLFDDYDNVSRVERLRRMLNHEAQFQDGLTELQIIAAMCASAGYEKDRIAIEPTVVRGLEYYTGPVFEAELTFEVKNDDGQLVRFGSVAGGGRYDGLVGRFRSEPVPATGFSIGVSRLLSALDHVGSPLAAAGSGAGPVVVLVMDRERVADYQAMVTRLRDAKIKAELYLGSAGMKAQMKYADRRGAPCVVIQGSEERTRGIVTVKDLFEGAERAKGDAGETSNADYRAARLAQISVPEQDLVEAVARIVSLHTK